MAKSLLISGHDGSTASTANTTQYFAIAGYSDFTNATTETHKQMTMRVAGTMSHLYFRINSETLAADCTIRTRVNAANGGQSVAFQTTGAFEDTVGTDAIVDGDETNLQSVPPAANTYFINFSHVTFVPSSNTVNILGCRGTFSVSSANRTAYQRLDGYTDSEGTTTESQAQCEQRKSGTFNKLQLVIASNARATTTTFRTRLNTANGGQSIAVTTETGIIEDSSGSDAVVATDDYNFQHVTGTGTNALACGLVTTFTSSASVSQYVAARNQAYQALGNDTTVVFTIQGAAYGVTSTTAQQCEVPDSWTESELTVRIITNTMDAGENNLFTLQENGSDTALVVTNTPGQTGVVSDSVNTVTSVENDLLQVTLNPAGQVGDSMTLGAVSLWATGPADAAGDTGGYGTDVFDIFLPIMVH